MKLFSYIMPSKNLILQQKYAQKLQNSEHFLHVLLYLDLKVIIYTWIKNEFT